MLSRRMKVMPQQKQIFGETHLILQIESGGIAEKEIEAELLSLITKHNPAYPFTSEHIQELGRESFQKLYAQGPQLYQVQERYINSNDSVSRLGGIYVPQRKREEVFKALRDIGYEINQ